MENILKILEDADAQLSEIKTKIEGVSTAGLADDLKEKRGILLKKQEAVHEVVLIKKIEIFEIIMSLGAFLLSDESIGYFPEATNPLTLRFGKKEDEVHVVPYRGSSRAQNYKLDDFVRKHESAFYAVCNNAMKVIENHVISTIKNGEKEFTKLAEVRDKLAKLKLSAD